jgi:hypothetical protein
MKARQAVDAIAVEERDGGVAELGGALDERFGQRGALQKAEGRGRVELDVHGENLELRTWNLEFVR